MKDFRFHQFVCEDAVHPGEDLSLAMNRLCMLGMNTLGFAQVDDKVIAPEYERLPFKPEGGPCVDKCHNDGSEQYCETKVVVQRRGRRVSSATAVLFYYHVTKQTVFTLWVPPRRIKIPGVRRIR